MLSGDAGVARAPVIRSGGKDRRAGAYLASSIIFVALAHSAHSAPPPQGLKYEAANSISAVSPEHTPAIPPVPFKVILASQAGEREGSSEASNAQSAQALLAQARDAEEHHQFLTAAKLYEEYLQKEPNQPAILQRLGLVYYLSNQYGKAIPVLRKALKLDPSLWGSALFLGISYYRTGSFDEAIDPLRRALALKPDLNDANFWLGAALLARGQPEPAVPYLRSVSLDSPLRLQADSLLVEAYGEAAESYYKRIAKVDPHSPRVHELKAQALSWEGLNDQALLEYQEASRAAPHLEGLHRAVGELYWQLRKYDLAAQEFNSELRINPLDTESNRRLGEYWVTKQDHTRAIGYLENALRAGTNQTAEAYHFLGLAELASNHLPQAEAALKRAIELDPQQPSNYRLLMMVYTQMGKPALADRESELFQKYSKGSSLARGSTR